MRIIEKLKSLQHNDSLYVEQVKTYKIFRYDVSKEIDLDKIRKASNQYRVDFPKKFVSHVKTSSGWRSDYYIHKNTDSFNSLFNLATQKLILSDDRNIPLQFYKLIHSWLIHYSKGDLTPYHHHLKPPIFFSATFYLDKSKTPIVFENNQKENLEIYPNAGTLLIWPAMVRHMVPKCVDDLRTVIGMNFGLYVTEEASQVDAY